MITEQQVFQPAEQHSMAAYKAVPRFLSSALMNMGPTTSIPTKLNHILFPVYVLPSSYSLLYLNTFPPYFWGFLYESFSSRSICTPLMAASRPCIKHTTVLDSHRDFKPLTGSVFISSMKLLQCWIQCLEYVLPICWANRFQNCAKPRTTRASSKCVTCLPPS